MSENSEKYAPVMEHLDELRTRLIRCALALLLGMVICLALFQQQLTRRDHGAFYDAESEHDLYYISGRISVSVENRFAGRLCDGKPGDYLADYAVCAAGSLQQ